MKKQGRFGSALMAAIVVVCFLLTALWAGSDGYLQEKDPWEFLLRYLLFLVGMAAAWVLALILHEAGHLVFGLATGYRFSSFRAGSLVIVREDGRLALRRYRIPGTGGQCLLAPPPWQEGRFPWFLYNLGGALMNVLCALLGTGIWALCPRGSLISAWLIAWVGVHVMGALENGIPLNNGLVVNDGGNILLLRKSPAARRALWDMLAVNSAFQTTRLRDMPEEWFTLPEEPWNALSAAIPVLRVDRALDRLDFPEARRLLTVVEELPVEGVHRAAEALNRFYLDLMEQGGGVDTSLLREAAAAPRREKSASHEPTALRERKLLLNYLRASWKTSLSVLRVRYAAACLKDRDFPGAEAIRSAFEAQARTCPYAGETAMERDLMDAALRQAQALPGGEQPPETDQEKAR